VAAEAREGDDEMITGINVTPMVDVVLVLLVIFIVTARLGAVPTVPHDLPTAASAGETEAVFTVSVDAQGHLAADHRPVTDGEELARAARLALAAAPETRVVIEAAGDARHSDVIAAMDTLRGAGATKVAFAVRRGAAPVSGDGKSR
jgi:biopolymer transport protein ExbD